MGFDVATGRYMVEINDNTVIKVLGANLVSSDDYDPESSSGYDAAPGVVKNPLPLTGRAGLQSSRNGWRSRMRTGTRRSR